MRRRTKSAQKGEVQRNKRNDSRVSTEKNLHKKVRYNETKEMIQELDPKLTKHLL